MAPSHNKIFQIGFNRCGTTSLHEFFLANNIRSVHWGRGEVALEIDRNRRLGRQLLGRFEPHFDAFTDMEEHHTQTYCAQFFQQLHKEHPDAYFILNTRPVDKWIASRFSLLGGSYARECAQILRLDGQQLIDFWKVEWHHHHKVVQEYFQNHSRFLVFNIETDDGEVLQTFLSPEYVTDPSTWGHHFPSEPVSPKAS
jgi:hypothetical protein